jgi:hypothetical protein
LIQPRRVARLVAAALIALLAGAACSRPPAAVTGTAQQDGWPAYAAGFVEEYLKSQPFFAVQAGRHEYDGQMPDYSAAGIAAQVARLKDWRARAVAFEAAALNADERFEREYLLSVIDTDLYWLERARAPFTNPVWYVDRLDPDVYLSREYAPLPQRLQGYLGYARAIPKIAADIRANLGTPLPASFIERGIAAFGGFADFYRYDVPKVFAAVQDPQAQQDLAAANEAAARAMDSVKAWLEGERARRRQFRARRGRLPRNAQGHRASRDPRGAARGRRPGGPGTQHPGAQGRMRTLRAQGNTVRLCAENAGRQALRRGGRRRPRAAGRPAQLRSRAPPRLSAE